MNMDVLPRIDKVFEDKKTFEINENNRIEKLKEYEKKDNWYSK
jgi:hypothetical protein